MDALTYLWLYYYFRFIIQKQVEKLLSSAEDKRRAVRATLFTIQDIIGNSINRLTLLLNETKESCSIDQDTLNKVENTIYSIKEKIIKIVNLKVIKTKELSDSVYRIDIK